jgi:hypothetical protein
MFPMFHKAEAHGFQFCLSALGLRECFLMGTADKPKTDLKASIASIGSFPDKSQTGKVRRQNQLRRQTGPDTLDYIGDFTIRGVTKPEKPTFTLSGQKGVGLRRD